MSKVDAVYAAKSAQEQEEAYDNWALDYEKDLFAIGYRSPGIISAIFTRFVSPDEGRVLDAGCGGGAQAEALGLLGYDVIGIDLSQGMLDVAESKGIYSELRQMEMGQSLDFQTDEFAALLSVGTLTPGHAPASSFDELIRVVRPGGKLVFSLRYDDGQDPSYFEALKHHETAKNWKQIWISDEYACMPYGEPNVTHRIHVYEVI